MSASMTDKSFRNLFYMCRQRGMKLQKPHPGSGNKYLYDLDGRWVAAHIAWRGAASITQHLFGSDLGFVRSGYDGKWLAIIDASELLDLMKDSQTLAELRAKQISEAQNASNETSNDIPNESEQSNGGTEQQS